MREKYLPIGTVVLLKGGKKRAMITGFCSVAQENQEKVYDYSGCVYPEGYLSSNQVCLFDHDQIDKIYFLGYEDEEEIMFKQKLNQIVKSIEANKQTEFTPVSDDSDFSSNSTTDNGTTNPSAVSSDSNGTIRPFAGL